MAQGVLVFIEEREGKVKKTSLEALSAARRLAADLGEPVSALRIGSGEPSVDLAHYGADRILWGSDFPLLSPSRYFREMAGAGLSSRARAKIQGGNIRRILDRQRKTGLGSNSGVEYRQTSSDSPITL